MNIQQTTRIKLFICTSLLFTLACNVSFAAGTPTAISTTIPTSTNFSPANPFTPIPAPSQTFTPIPTITSVPPTATSTVLISQQVSLTFIPIDESDPGNGYPQYTIKAQIPQLTGSGDPRVLAFNQLVNNRLTNEINIWRQSFRQLPITSVSYGSSLELRYALISQIGDLWSFKFDFWFYSDGAAHPGLNSITMTYDLGQGRELALGDLFLPNVNYLEVISNYCVNELRKRPYSDSFFLNGADPTPENYRNWNIAPDGLLITFDEYQVAPYAAGPQQVTVPYNELTSVINYQGPLAMIVK